MTGPAASDLKNPRGCLVLLLLEYPQRMKITLVQHQLFAILSYWAYSKKALLAQGPEMML